MEKLMDVKVLRKLNPRAKSLTLTLPMWYVKMLDLNLGDRVNIYCREKDSALIIKPGVRNERNKV